VLLIDDLIATGGTLAAGIKLMHQVAASRRGDALRCCACPCVLASSYAFLQLICELTSIA
jgi:phosphoribosylpyrophosphate synthetase